MTVQRQFLKQAKAIFGPLKWRMGLVLLGIAVVQGMTLLTPYIQGKIIDNLSNGRAIEETYKLILLAAALMLGTRWVIQFPREKYEIEKVDFDIDERASDHTMGQMMRLSVGQHNAIHSGMKHSIVSRGQQSLTTLVHLFVYEILPTISRVIIMIIAMCWLSAKLGLIVAASITLFLGLVTWMNFHFSTRLKKIEKMWNHESKFRNEIVQHIGHVLVNAQEKKARKEADDKYEETISYAKPVWQRFINGAYLRTLITDGTKILLLVVAARYYYAKELTLGDVVIFWAWSNNALDSVGQIGSLQRQVMRLWASIRRYCEFLSIENDVPVATEPVVIERLSGLIEVKNLSFTYDSRVAISPEEDEITRKPEKANRPALRNVNLTIHPGETVAIVGESGSGKTTLASLILRSSDPTEGKILIDGHDLRTLNPQSFREQIGTVEQHVPLFDRSMRDNILYGMNGKAGNVTADELDRIADVSQISRFKHKLEQGYDTVIGERGIKLSGGERQRVGIARALIKDPAILIFDEATSSLDAAVEAEIREAIKEASKGRTTIIIAHRFSTIRYANRIIVMDDGCVAAEGTHENLYASCLPYRRLVDHQLHQIGQ